MLKSRRKELSRADYKFEKTLRYITLLVELVLQSSRGSIIQLQVNTRSVIKMKGIIFFPLGLMVLLFVLSCDAVPKGQPFRFRSRSLPVSPTRHRRVNPTPTACLPKTTSGKYCSIPFTYKGVTYYSCTKIFHTRPWCSLDPTYSGRWENCDCPQKTTSGQCCSIPFTYHLVTYNSCTKVQHDRPWCSLDRFHIVNRWGNCVQSLQKTTSGQYCSIPFQYQGVTYNSCTKVNHNKPWCSLDPSYNSRWGNCTCFEDSLRIRKEFTSMTVEERTRYINAVFTASTTEPYKTDYETLLTSHRSLFFTDIHKKKHFLTWHRWFTLQYENILRRVDCSVTVPYWDWSSNNAFDTSDNGVWNGNEYGFGGNGTGDSSCVQTGPFREGVWSIVPVHNDPRIPNNCLARNFGSLPTEADVQDLLNTPAANFTEFEVQLRDVLHFNVHLGVGGTMFTFNSAAAPEFFLVHAFVDKIWDDWQQKSCAHKYAYFPTVEEKLPNSTTYPYEVIDLSSLPGNIQVKYQSNAKKRRRGQSLSERPSIRRELDPKIIKLFNVSSEEVEKVKKMGELVQQESYNRRELDTKIVKLFRVSPEEVEKVKKMEELDRGMPHIPRELDEKAEEKEKFIERGNNAYKYG